MKTTRTKIIILGPGRGHNMSLALNNLARTSNYTVYYFGAFYLDKNQFPSISVYNYRSQYSMVQWFYRVYFALIIPKSDVLYILGDAVPYDFYLLSLLGKFRKLVYNVWSQNNIPGRNAISKFQSTLFKKSDAIQCNWYETAEKFEEMYPEYAAKTFIIPWGMSYIWESLSNREEIQPFTSNLISQISDYKYRFINVRSIAPYNAIEEFLQAIVQLKQTRQRIFSQCLFVFWPGNNVVKSIEEHIIQQIKNHNLGKNVWYLEHPFLPDKDISTILNAFDFVVNLVKHDQFSTSIIEAMVLEKELLCSRIPPYENLNTRFGLNLPLTELTPESITELTIQLIENKNHKGAYKIFEHRKQWVFNSLSSENFLNNLNQMLTKILQK